MRRAILPLFSLSLCAASSSVACRPLLDGGWAGDANCGQSAFPIDAIFDETSDGKLGGFIFIEGILNAFIAKGTIETGKRLDDGSYQGDLNTDSDAQEEFTFDFAYRADTVDSVKGTVDQLDDNGNVSQTCTMSMDRQSVDD